MPEFVLQLPLAIAIDADTEEDARRIAADDTTRIHDTVDGMFIEPEDFEVIDTDE